MVKKCFSQSSSNWTSRMSFSSEGCRLSSLLFIFMMYITGVFSNSQKHQSEKQQVSFRVYQDHPESFRILMAPSGHLRIYQRPLGSFWVLQVPVKEATFKKKTQTHHPWCLNQNPTWMKLKRLENILSFSPMNTNNLQKKTNNVKNQFQSLDFGRTEADEQCSSWFQSPCT